MKNTSLEASEDKELKKFKRFNLLEPTLATLGFILVTLLFITTFFYLNFETAANSNRPRRVAWIGSINNSSSTMSLPSILASCGSERVGFFGEGGDSCDIFDGNWVWDDSYPLYKSPDCPFIDGGFRCAENGRPNDFYTKWRWQPKDCNLPRFLLIFFPLVFCTYKYLNGTFF